MIEARIQEPEEKNRIVAQGFSPDRIICNEKLGIKSQP